MHEIGSPCAAQGGRGGAQMTGRRIMQAILAAVLAIAVPLAFSQKDADTHAMPKYDASKEVKVKGSIEDIKEMTMGKGEVGVHLMVKTATETIEVRLCPSGYLKDFEFALAKGQQVEVTGSKVKVEEKDVILAREVVQGNNTLTLRDKQGSPVWTWLKKS
jgi:hypothetical protein